MTDDRFTVSNGSLSNMRPAIPANNIAHTAVAGSIAFPIAPGIVGDIPFALIPSTGKICLGIGGGTGSPGVNVGGVYSSANIQNVLSGASVSVAGQSGVRRRADNTQHKRNCRGQQHGVARSITYGYIFMVFLARRKGVAYE